jgi:hypothetical protein
MAVANYAYWDCARCGRLLGNHPETEFDEIGARAVLRNTAFPPTGLLDRFTGLAAKCRAIGPNWLNNFRVPHHSGTIAKLSGMATSPVSRVLQTDAIHSAVLWVLD